MKGQTREIIDFLILSVGTTILLILSYFLFTTKTPSLRNMIVEKHQYNRVTNIVINIFYTRIPDIDKTMTQLLGDMTFSGTEIVYYGDKYGALNVTKIIYDNFELYFNNNWNLEISYRGKYYYFGYDTPPNTRVRTFVMKLPIPSYVGDVANAVFKQW